MEPKVLHFMDESDKNNLSCFLTMKLLLLTMEREGLTETFLPQEFFR
jgi:hypothetical protein